ncbi:acriflavin resistance protein [Candidatus Endoriftia persephone str. Guaymas]|nr:efflux RND transporter permease subunit [endosymbiont of Riftia pachyptila]MBA1332984.1 acriflavin resistance protein [Candidatus Endoriftia persephone str. Guaymas]
MESLIRFSLKQRVFYNLMFVVLMVVGFISIFAMPAERYPNFGFGEVIINTIYPGASAVEVETLVTRKIEDALETVDDVEWVNATSFSGRSNVRLKFVDDSDYEALYDEVRFEVLNIINELPEGVDPPHMLYVTVQDWLPVIAVNLVGEHSNRALALMAEELKSRLKQIPNVQEVKLSGEDVQEFHVSLDPAKLRALGVSYERVAAALSSANLSIPAGKFTASSGEFLVKVDERFVSREQVLQTVVRKDADASLVRVADLISHAGMGYRDPVVISSVNGRPSLGLQVIKSDAGNAMRIRDAVVALLEEFRPLLAAQGVELVLTQDSTVYIEDGLNTLGMNMLVGIVLVSLIIWYFMGIRNAGLVTIGIPFSFMITMLIMYLTGNSFNEITLFSFVLVTGIIVDDAIVVTENIYRHVQEGEPLQQAIVSGTAEVALPVISATMTTVAAFLPMLIMSGTTGQFFALVPKAVTFAILASLVECLLILPIHYLDFGPRGGSMIKAVERDNLLLRLLRSFTDRVLRFTLRFRLTSVLLVVIAFGAAVVILGLSVSGKAPLIRIQFFPDDYKLYYVDVVGPSNTPIETIDRKVRTIAEAVMEDGPGYARSAAGFAGYYFNEDYEPVFGNNHGSVMVTMPAVAEQAFADPLAHLERMRQRLKPRFETDGYQLHIHPQKDGPPTGKDINVRIVGSKTETVAALAAELLSFMRADPDIGPHLLDLADDQGRPRRVIRLEVLQDRVAEYGLDNARVARLAASVLDGRYIGKYRHLDEEIDLKLYVDQAQLTEPEHALYLPVVEDADRPVHLADLVRLHSYSEPGEIKRYQGQRAISLKGNIKEGAPTSTPAIVSAVRAHYETLRDRYPGATVIFGGEHEDTQRSFESLAYAFIIAVLVMYVILATQFQSYLQPMIILSAIIFALIGVVFGKLVSQSLFTVNSFIAVIGVAGVVVNDALVLIDFINRRYRSGMARRQAIIEGVHVRLRPIVLTTLTTTLGLLPMALGIPSYSLVWGSMASTFVTGLATATALTLFIVPVLWDLLTGLEERRQRRRKGTNRSVDLDVDEHEQITG